MLQWEKQSLCLSFKWPVELLGLRELGVRQSSEVLNPSWNEAAFLGTQLSCFPSRSTSDFGGGEKKRIDSNKNVFVWEKLFPSMRKHIVWGKFMALAWSLISGCQKVLVWTKICCNKNALFWRNLLSPWKPIQFRKICWFQWKSICFKRQRERGRERKGEKLYSAENQGLISVQISLWSLGWRNPENGTVMETCLPRALSHTQWSSFQLEESAPPPPG